MSIRGAVAPAAAVVMLTTTLAAVAPVSASAGPNWIKWFQSPRFATVSECVAEKNRYAVDYGLDVRPAGNVCYSAYYFEYAQEF
jgi:hypothetical protein